MNELLNKSQEYFLNNTEVSVKEIDSVDDAVKYDKYQYSKTSTNKNSHKVKILDNSIINDVYCAGSKVVNPYLNMQKNQTNIADQIKSINKATSKKK